MQLKSHPLRGSLFENMVVADIRKGFTNSGRNPRMSFYRTEKGFEVDVIVEAKGKIVPIEIKSSMTYGKNLIHNLELYCDADMSAITPHLIYDGVDMVNLGSKCVRAENWRTGIVLTTKRGWCSFENEVLWTGGLLAAVRTEDKRQKTEDGRTRDGGQRTEDRGW